MKTILPWVVAVLAIGSAVLLFKSNQSKSGELAKFQSEVQTLETLRTEIAELKSQQVPAEEITQLRKDREDLLRLRNEVGQLRNEKQQLAKQAQSAQTALVGAQAETQRIREQAHAHATSDAQAQVLANAQNQQLAQIINTCINNLRQIDRAKQQWTLEHNTTAEAVPTAQDITPYLKGGFPLCPAAGSYTINAGTAAPTCSVAGHALGTQ